MYLTKSLPPFAYSGALAQLPRMILTFRPTDVTTLLSAFAAVQVASFVLTVSAEEEGIRNTCMFIGSACATDFFCLPLNIEYGCRADLGDGIGSTAQFGCEIHVSKKMLQLESWAFLTSCQ